MINDYLKLAIAQAVATVLMGREAKFIPYVVLYLRLATSAILSYGQHYKAL